MAGSSVVPWTIFDCPHHSLEIKTTSSLGHLAQWCDSGRANRLLPHVAQRNDELPRSNGHSCRKRPSDGSLEGRAGFPSAEPVCGPHCLHTNAVISGQIRQLIWSPMSHSCETNRVGLSLTTGPCSVSSRRRIPSVTQLVVDYFSYWRSVFGLRNMNIIFQHSKWIHRSLMCNCGKRTGSLPIHPVRSASSRVHTGRRIAVAISVVEGISLNVIHIHANVYQLNHTCSNSTHSGLNGHLQGVRLPRFVVAWAFKAPPTFWKLQLICI